MTGEILLSFSGPFRLSGIANGFYPSLEPSGGIYLQTIEHEGTYYIYYVGQSVNFVNRHIDHMRHLQNGNSTLVRKETDDNGRLIGLELVYIPGVDKFDEAGNNELALKNIDETWVFLGQIHNGSNYDKKEIEGAIQLHLYRKTETRKFLITGVSKYSLRHSVKYSFCQQNVRVLGLESSGIISCHNRAQ